MKDFEKDLLSDALKAAIEANVKIVKLKKIILLENTVLIIIALMGILKWIEVF